MIVIQLTPSELQRHVKLLAKLGGTMERVLLKTVTQGDPLIISEHVY